MSGDRQHIDALVGERLRCERKRRRLTLSEVETASSGEFRTSVLGAYERGERGVSVARLLRLADLYGVEPAVLLPCISPEPSSSFPPDAVL